MSALALSSAEMGIPSIDRRLGCLNTRRGRCMSLLATGLLVRDISLRAGRHSNFSNSARSWRGSGSVDGARWGCGSVNSVIWRGGVWVS